MQTESGNVVLATLSPDERWFLRPKRWDVPEVALGTQVQLEVADQLNNGYVSVDDIYLSDVPENHGSWEVPSMHNPYRKGRIAIGSSHFSTCSTPVLAL